jgi:acyl-CoA thioesterase I
VDFPEPDGPIRPIASRAATRRLMSLRICTRAAPVPSERLTFEMEMASGARPASDEGSMRLSMARSYGTSVAAVEGKRRLFVHMIVWVLALSEVITAPLPAVAAAKPVAMVVLGDSLSAGYGLPAAAAFPAKLEKALKSSGLDVKIGNAGVSGDTSSGGRDRLDWSVPEGTDAVILELGANDALRGTDPEVTRAALSDILTRLKARGVAVLLCGMLAPPNYGSDYAKRFDAIYPELANSFGVPLYPFFLEGVAADAKLNQTDGMHPTAEGIDVIVKNILPTVKAFLGSLPAHHD